MHVFVLDTISERFFVLDLFINEQEYPIVALDFLH
jgi:hypothetical protein